LPGSGSRICCGGCALTCDHAHGATTATPLKLVAGLAHETLRVHRHACVPVVRAHGHLGAHCISVRRERASAGTLDRGVCLAEECNVPMVSVVAEDEEEEEEEDGELWRGMVASRSTSCTICSTGKPNACRVCAHTTYKQAPTCTQQSVTCSRAAEQSAWQVVRAGDGTPVLPAPVSAACEITTQSMD
jgi:hypothetical protein